MVTRKLKRELELDLLSLLTPLSVANFSTRGKMWTTEKFITDEKGPEINLVAGKLINLFGK